MGIHIKIKTAWQLRLKLRAEGDKLRAEGDKLRAESNKLRAEGDKLRAEGDKLRAEGDKLRAEGDIAILSSVVEIFGNIKIEWKNWNNTHSSYELHLENGIALGFDEGMEAA